ncbi:FtsX-like permease family protein [Streptomyces sp. NBC_01187]|uniref:FtsX-like permease family protein n=1 Tax=Streptomyces sp. NBC_01187 TaxID=2903766 RepID=UPI00386D641C|nr:FtsX-like permease family protein [Streptomyces sp. NBC_01187]
MSGFTGFVLLRVRAHRLLVAAALLAVILATSVLAALAAFSAAIGDAGLRRSLGHQSASRTVLDVRSEVTAEDRERADAAVREAAHRAFDGLPVTVDASTGSGAYALPRELRPADAGAGDAGAADARAGGARAGGAQAPENPDLTRFASLGEKHVRMVEGSWPRAARDGDTVPVAVPQRAAERLSLHPGDTFRATSRLHGPPDVRVKVTGVYTPRSPGSSFWRLDPLKGKGVETLDFTTYGPLAVPEDSFAAGTAAPPGASAPAGSAHPASSHPASSAHGRAPLWPAETRWQARADFAHAGVARIPHLREDIKHTVTALGRSKAAPEAVAGSELPTLLHSLERSLLVMRSTLLIAALQLALLTGLALLLVAQLLMSERAAETALLRARGASRARVCALAGMEALLLAVPAALAAPLLAGPSVRWLTGYGAPARAGVHPVARLPADSWWVAAATATGCALMIALPTLRGRGRAGADDPENGGGSAPRAVSRGRRTAATLLRGGADLALVALAVVAYWQLERRSAGTGVLSSGQKPGSSGGTLGIDPVLVAAPALGLLAGTVLVLRLLPLVARFGERRATRGRGLAPALAGWQLSRRPLRGAGPALLLVLAVATGVFAVGQGASWDRSQDDQADFTTGAEVTVGRSTASAIAQGGLYDGIRGVQAVAPVARTVFTAEGNRSTQVVATDAKAAGAGVLRMRGDLADAPLSRLLRPLAPKTDAKNAGIRLPADTRALRLRVRLDARSEAKGGEDGGKGHDEKGHGVKGNGVKGNGGGDSEGLDRTGTEESLTLTVEDRYGVPYRFLLGDVPADGRPHTLKAVMAEGGGTPAGPLRVTRLGVAYTAPAESERRRLSVESLRTTGERRTRAVRAARAVRWSSHTRTDDPQSSLGRGPYAEPHAGSARSRTDGAPLTFDHTTGSAPEPEPHGSEPVAVTMELRASADRPAPLAAVATDAYLRAGGAKVGDRVKARISGSDLTVRIAGSVRALPTVPAGAGAGGDGAGALLFDLATLDRALADRDATLLEPDAWWLTTAQGSTERVARALRKDPALGTVRVRDELAARLHGDPLGAGPRSALSAIALAAAVLAATGFAVSTAGAARERAGEFAVLRALGAPRRRLAQALAAEQGLLVALSTALGLALGVLLTRLVVPLIVLTSDARLPVPELVVRLPLGPLGALLAAVLAVPLLVVAATAVRRTDPVAALRTERGE